MTLPRKKMVSLAETPYYHCVSRCVRRTYLCGFDQYTSKSYEHRRDWLEFKLLNTADIFAIKLCAYAVMSNHYHVVLHVRPDISKSWSEFEVARRWSTLFKGTLLSQRLLKGQALKEVEWGVLRRDIKRWRQRLTDISWFMRIVNESIARQANKEDRCTGRFWEGRFKSQALLDERALLSCMAYVDLNPVRADMAKTPETSSYTAIHRRLQILNQRMPQSPSLESFVDVTKSATGIPFTLKDYVELVDWSGRIIRANKRGHIQQNAPPILNRLELNTEAWRILTTEFESRFQCWVGSEHIVKRVCEDNGYQRNPPTQPHRTLFG